MDIKTALAAIKAGLDYAEALRPVISILGGDTVLTAVRSVEAVAEIAANIKERIEEGKVVATTNDTVLLDTYISRISAENDRLAEYIENS